MINRRSFFKRAALAGSLLIVNPKSLLSVPKKAIVPVKAFTSSISNAFVLQYSAEVKRLYGQTKSRLRKE